MGSRVFVPQYLARPLLPYLNFLAQEIERNMRHRPSIRRPQVFLTTPKHVLNLPLKSRVILVQSEQTNFDPKKIEDVEAVDPNRDPAIAEVIHGIRIHGPLEAFLRADRIIDYSRANVRNILESKLSYLYDGKAEYIAPLIPNQPANTGPRSGGQVTTMFGDPTKGRRSVLTEALKEAGIRATNIKDQFDYNNAFKDSSVLLNVSQVPYFQTPEELRILPALLQRVIVISEDLPNLSDLDYRSLIEVARFDEIVKVTENLLRDYEEKWFSIFGPSQGGPSLLDRKIAELQEANQLAFNRIML